MSNMDADSKAILESIIATSENPLMDIMANICAGKSSARVPVEAKPSRSRSNSNSSDSSDTGAAFLRFMESISSDSSQSDAGPSSDSKGKDAEDKEEKPESLVDRVKRQKLDQYERPFLDCIVDTDEIASDFDSVCLPEDTVDTLRSLVSLPLLCPEEFQTGILKQHSMSGALLFGPPGTGKTLFAQAIAKESGANMISVKPSDILDKCVGESEKLVRGLFKLARRLHPCVVFIDELDALFGARTHAGQQNSARWHTSMLTEFMQEMDGLMASRVVVIGATNRPFDLDDAVIRRLPCRMLIDLPDQGARQEIMRILLRDEALAEDVKLESLAGKTDNYSGSDLKNLCVAAAVNAVKDNVSVPWKTGSKKGKERAPGQSYARARPSANIFPVSEHTGASIVEVTEGEDTDSPSPTLKSTPDPTGPSTDASTPPSPKPEPARNNSPFISSRVLANQHFSHALTQVGASSAADQTNLNEIRTWNAKFGSGASKMSSILGGGYAGRPGVPPYNPSSAGTGVPGYGPRPGGNGMFGGASAGSGISGIGSSSGTGIPGYGASSAGTGIPGYDAAGAGAGIPGYASAGAGGGMSGYPSSTGTGVSGINGTGAGAGMGSGMSGRMSMGAGMGAGIGSGMAAGMGAGAGTGGPRFDHGGPGGGSMAYTGPGASGAGTGIPGYASAGNGMNFGAGALAGGRDMSWLQRPSASSGLGLGSDDFDYSSIAAAARQAGAGSGAGFSSESALGKAVGA